MLIQPLVESSTADIDDRELVSRSQGGSRDALEVLITRHHAWIYNIALRMLYLPQDAEDATQEILIKLITKLSTFEGRSSFRTYGVTFIILPTQTRAEADTKAAAALRLAQGRQARTPRSSPFARRGRCRRNGSPPTRHSGRGGEYHREAERSGSISSLDLRSPCEDLYIAKQ